MTVLVQLYFGIGMFFVLIFHTFGKQIMIEVIRQAIRKECWRKAEIFDEKVFKNSLHITMAIYSVISFFIWPVAIYCLMKRRDHG